MELNHNGVTYVSEFGLNCSKCAFYWRDGGLYDACILEEDGEKEFVMNTCGRAQRAKAFNIVWIKKPSTPFEKWWDSKSKDLLLAEDQFAKNVAKIAWNAAIESITSSATRSTAQRDCQLSIQFTDVKDSLNDVFHCFD